MDNPGQHVSAEFVGAEQVFAAGAEQTAVRVDGGGGLPGEWAQGGDGDDGGQDAGGDHRSHVAHQCPQYGPAWRFDLSGRFGTRGQIEFHSASYGSGGGR